MNGKTGEIGASVESYDSRCAAADLVIWARPGKGQGQLAMAGKAERRVKAGGAGKARAIRLS